MKKSLIGAIVTVSLMIAGSSVCYANFEPISKGASGDIVYEVQELLKEYGYLAGTVDGIFGNGTYEAVSAFQRENGLEVTGVIGESTYEAIKVYSGEVDTASDGKKVEEPENTDEKMVKEIISNENSVIIETDGILEISKAGYSVSNGFIYYAVVVHNNSEESAVFYPEYRITARDEKGEVIGTTEQVLDIIYPGQDYVWAGLGFDVPKTPETVEFEVKEPDEYNISEVSLLEHSEFVSLEAKGVNCNKDEFMGYTFTGEIYNPNDYELPAICVFVVLKDEEGAIVGGEMTFADNLKADGTVPFEIYLFEDIEFFDYEIYANTWL